MKKLPATFLIPGFLLSLSISAAAPFREEPARSDERGVHPAAGEMLRVTPAPFVWREQRGARSYELQYARNPEFHNGVTAAPLRWNVHCPAARMAPGTWYWRVRFVDQRGEPSQWSSVRKFEIASDAAVNPMPTRAEWERQIPAKHPRIFLRPEELPKLRRSKPELLAELTRQCEALLASPPSTKEPPKYPEGVKRPSPEWIKIWWGNRLHVMKTLDGAATLGYGYQITGKREYGNLAKKILLECARWDPEGSTSRRYNDEAGMPYLSRFSRTYSYVQELLTEPERELCRRVIRIRGNEAFHSLYPRLFFRPYDSHANRLWHFLGEAGVVFFGEIPEAGDWIDGAMHYYFCLYPVWGDEDGGWHEGISYWREYMERFFWWADILDNTFHIDIRRKPFFARTGYYGMYVSVPGTRDGGFGDLSENHRCRHAGAMSTLATLAGDSNLQWYAERITDIMRRTDPKGAAAAKEAIYIDFLRASRPRVKPVPPTALPTSRCFRGNGLAVLNTTLLHGKKNIQLQFKSSPVGTWSHGYDANNSFLLNVFGERMLIRSGRRDMYASNFHSNWMWETKSENNITVNGIGQKKHSRDAKGEIIRFVTGKTFDYVEGEAAGSYEGRIRSFRRRILFAKPSAILISDTLETPEPAIFNWHLHALNPFRVNGQNDILLENNQAACKVEFLRPEGLKLTVTDRFDPPPPPHLKLRQYHLTADTPKPVRKVLFLTLLRPHRAGTPPTGETRLEERGDQLHITLPTPEGELCFSVNRNDGSITARYKGEEFR